jgi:hypothetical protein
MTDRQRKLLGRGAMVAAGVFVVYLLLNFFIFAPAGELADREARLQNEVRKLNRRNDRETRYLGILRRYARETYGRDQALVSEQIRVRLEKMIGLSGLRRNGAAQPVTGQAKPNSYREIGWRYDLLGRLEQVADMLYLLREDPYLHRVEGLSIVPQRDGRTVKLSFRYMTIVIDEDLLELKRKVGADRQTIRTATASSDESLPLPTLGEESPRPACAVVVAREPFRPYVKKRPKPQPPRHIAQPNPPASPQEPAPRRDRFKVVSLTDWNGEQDISVKDTETGEIRRYNPGDPLAGGSIVMVDYREMPKPDQPDLLSPSRVIVQLGENYFAVELGDSLAGKHRLDSDQLPPELKK